MRLAVLTNDYPPASAGGAGVIADIQARALRQRGHEVEVFHSPPTWSSRHPVARLFFHFCDLKANRALVARLQSWKPEILLTHNLTGCGFGTPRLVQTQGIPWIHFLHDVQAIEPSGKILAGESLAGLRKVWRFFWSGLRRHVMGEPTGVVSPTAWLLDFHRRHGFFKKSRSRVIPNPVDMESEARDFSNDKGRILLVGRVEKDKGADILLAAWKSLGPDRPELVVIGDGAFRKSWEEERDPKIKLLGRLRHEEVVELIRKPAVVVAPSRLMENQPTVILEALSAGCRVVATDVGGVSETLGGAGWIVPPGDEKALAQGLRAALSETKPDEGERRRILELHRPDVSLGALEDFLRSNL